MERYEATVRLFDLVEPDAAAARRTVEDRLRIAGFTSWQVIALAKEGAIVAPAKRAARRTVRPQPSYLGGRALVLGVVLWSLWLLWLLAG
jgi:hypothetical protein